MITPIRGRKLLDSTKFHVGARNIRNDNPDKGTETLLLPVLLCFCSLIRNDNPDKGTETNALQPIIRPSSSIRNDNPDKGTETKND